MLFLATASFGLSLGGVSRVGTPTMVASPPVPDRKMDLVEPVFPEVCEFAGVTLSRYVLEMARANPDKPELNELGE